MSSLATREKMDSNADAAEMKRREDKAKEGLEIRQKMLELEREMEEIKTREAILQRASLILQEATTRSQGKATHVIYVSWKRNLNEYKAKVAKKEKKEAERKAQKVLCFHCRADA